MRVFLLTIFVVDDLVALRGDRGRVQRDGQIMPILLAAVALAVMVGMLGLGVDRSPAYLLLGVVMWARC